MEKFRYPLLNSLILCLTLFINYWSNTGAIAGRTIADISKLYENLFTPAGYAFSIWGVIYLFLIALIVAQYFYVSRNKLEPVHIIGYSLVIANALNAIWVVLWLNEMLGLSVLVMILLLITLTRLTVRLSGWISNSVWDFWLVKLPIYLYQGWIIVALVANCSAYLTAHIELPFSDTFWTVTLLLIAFVVYLYESLKLRQYISALVGVWGIAAIGVKQLYVVDSVALVAFGVATLLLLLVVSSSVVKRVLL